MVAHPLQSHKLSVSEGPEDQPRPAQIVTGGVVYQSGEHAGSDKQAEYGPEEQRGCVIAGKGELCRLDLTDEEQIGQAEGEDIHQSVPAQRQAGDDLGCQPCGKITVKQHHEQSLRTAGLGALSGPLCRTDSFLDVRGKPAAAHCSQGLGSFGKLYARNWLWSIGG